MCVCLWVTLCFDIVRCDLLIDSKQLVCKLAANC